MNKKRKAGLVGGKNMTSKKQKNKSRIQEREKNQEKQKPIKFVFEGKRYNIKNYIECTSIFSQIRGLMFRPRKFKTPLLFIWKKPDKRAIHSFFCRRFIAVWILNRKIVEIKIIKPWENCVIPDGIFNYLLEVPC